MLQQLVVVDEVVVDEAVVGPLQPMVTQPQQLWP
jgi:hypothetical protein